MHECEVKVTDGVEFGYLQCELEMLYTTKYQGTIKHDEGLTKLYKRDQTYLPPFRDVIISISEIL